MALSDPFEHPAARAWAQRVVDEVLPMIRDSAASVSIVPDLAGVTDIKFAVELGLSIMLDKPIILAVAPGRAIPERLARVADEIIELDTVDQQSTAKRLRAAIDRVVGS